MAGIQPLLAFDIGDVIKIVVVILFFVIPLLAKLFSQGEAQQPAQPRRRRAGGNPAGNAGKAGGKAGRGEDDEINREIETFLQQTAQQRGGRPQRDVEVVRPARLARPAGEEIIVAEMVDGGLGRGGLGRGGLGRGGLGRGGLGRGGLGRDVASHVERHLGTSEFDERTEHLGQQVGQADELMAGQLHEKFDHQLGSLTDTSVGAILPVEQDQDADGAFDEPTGRRIGGTPTSAAGFAALLASNKDVRQAIVLNEILKRPEERGF